MNLHFKENVKGFIEIDNAVLTMSQIRVVLVDDHPAVRMGIRKMLERAGNFQVVGDAQNGAQALKVIHELHPDVVLLDIELPDIKGYEVARRITEEGLGVNILALSAHANKNYILKMFSSGAVGYITKEEAPHQIVEAIRKIVAGEVGWLSPYAANQLKAAAIQDRAFVQNLSENEQTILQWIAAGKSNQEIGEQLGLDSKAASLTVNAILSKLGVSSRSDTHPYSI
jgi:DNA-binding NarL/FixJ family response regulator